MINKEVFAQICAKLKVGTRMTHIAINKKKEEYGFSITRETAAYILASDNGIDISKYLEVNELAEVREARKGHSPTATLIKTNASRKAGKIDVKEITVNIGQKITFKHSFLTESASNDAKEMAEKVYPIVYLFENSARGLILNLMQRTHGPGWWDTKVTSPVKKIVQSRIGSEERDRWHSKRGAHQIFYTDLGDLSSIITNNWDVFEPVFSKQSWITQRFNEIELSRNIIAHNNHLEEREIDRIKLYFEDWNKQISKFDINNVKINDK